MSFCQHFFQKEIEQITFEDISNLILNQPDLETTYLECKSWKCRKSVKEEFQKEVKVIVGFLNTNGGLLILGTPKEQHLNPNDPSKGKVLQGPFHFR